ncbi:MAG: hypothetical protein IT581_23060 [Verrucomicrobiales bacterium]|nr:hypothetical protein [Verrucomicrobiales bacterium]
MAALAAIIAEPTQAADLEATTTPLSVPSVAFARVDREIVEDYSVRAWGIADGLPSDQVLCLARTRDGYLWAGTSAGLVRFDGVRFVRFDHAKVRALNDDRMLRIVEDAGGNLWMTSEDHALRVFGPQGWMIPRFQGKPVTMNAWPTRDGQGGVWAFTTDGWLRSTSACQLEKPTGAGTDAVAWMEDSEFDRGWVEFNRVVLEQIRKPATNSFPLEPVEQRNMAVAATALSSDASRWIFFGEYNCPRPFHLYRIANQEMKRVDGELPSPGRLPMFLTPDRDGGVWHLAPEGRIGRATPTSGIRYTLPAGRTRDQPMDVLADDDGDVWLALERGGLLQLRPRRMQSFGPSLGLPSLVVRSIVSSSSESVWVGTDNGVARLDHLTPAGVGTFRGGGLEGASVRALAIDTHGALWAGTARGLFAEHGGVWMPKRMPEQVRDSDGDGLGSLKVRDLLALRSGELWVATAHQIVVVPEDGGEPRRLAAVANLEPADLMEDRAGNIWIATERGGVVVIGAASRATLAAHDFAPVPGFMEDRWRFEPAGWLRENHGLPSDHTWELLEDHEGTVWITGSRGLIRIPAAGARAIAAGQPLPSGQDFGAFVFTERHGLPESSLNSLVEDHLDALWLGGDRGIYRISLAAFRNVAEGRSPGISVESFTRAEGLPSDETNGRVSHHGAIKDDRHRLWFGTTGGLVCFPPQSSPPSEASPKVVIEEVRINAEVLTTTLPQLPEGGKTRPVTSNHADGEAETDETRGNATSRITSRNVLAPGRGRVVEIRFTGLDPTAPRELRFRYQLAGFDEEFHDVEDRRAAYFTNLKPGRYLFRVWAIGRAGVWSKVPAEFEFTLTPHLWQTKWFQALTATTLLAAGFGIVTLRIRQVRRLEELRRRADQAELRARLARDLHDGVGSGLARLAVLAHLPEDLHLTPETVTSRWRDLSGAVRELAETVREISWNSNPSPISLESLVAQIAQQTGEYLGAAGIRCRTSLPLEFPNYQLTPDQRADLYFAAKELCSNTLRHAKATEARFEAVLSERTLILALHDNGQGFAVQDVQDSDADPRSHSASKDGGNGIPNLRARVNRLGGRLVFESAPGTGTSVRLEIPLDRLRPGDDAPRS